MHTETGEQKGILERKRKVCCLGLINLFLNEYIMLYRNIFIEIIYRNSTVVTKGNVRTKKPRKRKRVGSKNKVSGYFT